VHYTIRHSFDTDAGTFWEMFFDPEYNRALFEDHLKFKVYRVLELDKRADGTIVRRVECAPAVEVPAVAKKIFGDATGYVEEGRFDPKTQRFVVTVTPKVGADRIQTRAEMRVEARGDKRIERIQDIDNTVKVFGVGKVIEGIIEAETRKTYDASADFTRKWLAGKT
jgi:hypothetical protein